MRRNAMHFFDFGKNALHIEEEKNCAAVLRARNASDVVHNPEKQKNCETVFRAEQGSSEHSLNEEAHKAFREMEKVYEKCLHFC
jgi:formylmethanofuran dehydrogenase subunit E